MFGIVCLFFIRRWTFDVRCWTFIFSAQQKTPSRYQEGVIQINLLLFQLGKLLCQCGSFCRLHIPYHESGFFATHL